MPNRPEFTDFAFDEDPELDELIAPDIDFGAERPTSSIGSDPVRQRRINLAAGASALTVAVVAMLWVFDRSELDHSEAGASAEAKVEDAAPEAPVAQTTSDEPAPIEARPTLAAGAPEAAQPQRRVAKAPPPPPSSMRVPTSPPPTKRRLAAAAKPKPVAKPKPAPTPKPAVVAPVPAASPEPVAVTDAAPSLGDLPDLDTPLRKPPSLGVELPQPPGPALGGVAPTPEPVAPEQDEPAAEEPAAEQPAAEEPAPVPDEPAPVAPESAPEP